MQSDNSAVEQSWNLTIKALVVALGVLVILIWWNNGPIPQNPLYHLFADQRTLVSIPHAWDVLSNVPFCLFGLTGIYTVWIRRRLVNRFTGLYLTFFLGVFFTGFGSAFYHFNPTNSSLVWDRLPMSVGFMSIFAAIVAERVHLKLGQKLFPWLVAAGIFSVLYWHWQDDLRPYLLVQFGTLAALPLILLLYRRSDSGFLWIAIAFYVLAKVFEVYDTQIYILTSEWVSGHSLKHLAASITPLMIVMKLHLEPYSRMLPLGSIYRVEDAVQDNTSPEQIRLAKIMGRKYLKKTYRGC